MSVYAASTGTYGAAVSNDVRNAAECRLQIIDDVDLDQLFDRQRDPGCFAMAAFTRV